MRSTLASWVKIGVGILFVLLGIVGLFLPILQGILFLFIGLAILLSQIRAARRLYVRTKRRWPWLVRPFEAWRDRRRRRRRERLEEDEEADDVP